MMWGGTNEQEVVVVGGSLNTWSYTDSFNLMNKQWGGRDKVNERDRGREGRREHGGEPYCVSVYMTNDLSRCPISKFADT